jgi:hypothetical protein
METSGEEAQVRNPELPQEGRGLKRGHDTVVLARFYAILPSIRTVVHLVKKYLVSFGT